MGARLGAAQLAEDQHLVQPVQHLRPEERLHRAVAQMSDYTTSKPLLLTHCMQVSTQRAQRSTEESGE